MVDLRQLEALAALERLGTVSDAARALNISQQACSARLKALEKHLGHTLCERTATGLTLTDTGRIINGWAANLLNGAQEFNSLVASLSPTPTAQLRLGASLTVAEYLLPAWLHHHREHHPHRDVTVRAENSHSIAHAVETGEIDLGIIESPTWPTTLSARQVSTDAMDIVVTPQHPWAHHTPSPQRVATTQLISREQGSGTRATIDQGFARLGLTPAPAHTEVTSTVAGLSLTRAGIAPAILSRRVVADDISRGTLVAVAVNGLHFIRPITALWAGEKPSPGAQEFLTALNKP
ncbi:LysR family transcriptional regulator [Corynebacterium aquilae]|uniref:HTH lysR-type domain-containing protein n=1 Tax=Corynebacterium aquilae DSM 44791 TaxID=1431546 RepID=A0A1L7CIA9_9CORY|nr:LysR family transcriptional regulator [Corynebacterium aquilae]APT85591.1 hypothetical protein CAQU_11675 [Corynebacterium aquilae DSM 44791]